MSVRVAELPDHLVTPWICLQQMQHKAQHENGPYQGHFLETVADSACYGWLGNLDSNQDKQSQSLLCYRYTIPHRNADQFQSIAELSGTVL